MRSREITIGNGETVILGPVARSQLGPLNALMLLIQSRWIENSFSTGDTVMNDDTWELMGKVVAMLPRIDAPGTCGFDMQKIESDYDLVERLFFNQAGAIGLGSDGYDATTMKACIVYELHSFEPQKKMREAYQLYQEKNSKGQSRASKSRTKAAA